MASYSSEDEQDIDEFEDATDQLPVIPLPADMTLDRAVEESQRAVNYFFNNQFDEAKRLMDPYANVSVYHTLGHSVFLFLEAMLTFNPTHIQTASKALKHSMVVCNRFRKKRTLGESIGKMVSKQNFDQISEEEAHAELCHAECMLLKSMLSFMEDETLSTFIKAGMNIRSCYGSYKDCQKILQQKNWDNSKTKSHFDSGVKMGIGTFNLMISMMPSRVIKLLEFIGFSGNKELGLEDLNKGMEMDGLRKILCIMTLLGYNLVVVFVITHTEGDLVTSEKILNEQLKIHPDGVWFLYFKGRLEFMKGNLNESREWYIRSWKSQDHWPQFHHLCFWELLWLEVIQGNYNQALEYSSYLLEDSKWSRTMYSYQKACIMLMLGDRLTKDDKETIKNLLKDVPKYKQRIAGKSIPMEKFAIKKSERFFNQNDNLVLPIIELLYLWNLFKTMKTFEVANNTLKLIEKEEQVLNAAKKKTKYHNDNKALVSLLKGACLKNVGNSLLALDCFEDVIAMQKDLVEDHYLVPYAIVELALIEWKEGNREKAILALEDAKKNYTGYSLESRLHFRIHTALSEFKQQYKNGNKE